MKIAGNNPIIEAVARSQGVKNAVKARPGLDRAKAANFVDKVDFSAKAKKLAGLVKAAISSPEARQEISERIEDGIEAGRINDRTARMARGVYTKAVDFYKSNPHPL